MFNYPLQVGNLGLFQFSVIGFEHNQKVNYVSHFLTALETMKKKMLSCSPSPSPAPPKKKKQTQKPIHQTPLSSCSTDTWQAIQQLFLLKLYYGCMQDKI